MRAVGRLVQEMCTETRAGWSWMLCLAPGEAPGLLVFHGEKGCRGDEAARLQTPPSANGPVGRGERDQLEGRAADLLAPLPLNQPADLGEADQPAARPRGRQAPRPADGLTRHGDRGWRRDPYPALSPQRLELWRAGRNTGPVLMLPLTPKQDLRADAHRLSRRPLDPTPGWLLLLGLLHALDEAARARPRVPTVGEALTSTGDPRLGAWASALMLGDLEAALLSSPDRR